MFDRKMEQWYPNDDSGIAGVRCEYCGEPIISGCETYLERYYNFLTLCYCDSDCLVKDMIKYGEVEEK